MYRRTQPTTPRRRGSLLALVDLHFEELVTPKLIKAMYVIVLIMTSVTVFIWVWAGFYLPDWMGWGIKVMFVFGLPAAGLVGIAAVRMILEFMIIQFEIREELRAVRINLERMNNPTAPPAPAPYSSYGPALTGMPTPFPNSQFLRKRVQRPSDGGQPNTS